MVLEAALCALEHLLTVTAFPYICGLGVSKFVGGLSGHKLAAKGGIDGCRFYYYADFSCSAA